jgi:hypothetical protein
VDDRYSSTAEQLVKLLAANGRVDEAISVLRPHANDRYSGAPAQLAELLTATGHVDEAITILQARPDQRAKQRLTVAATFLAWLASRGHQPGDCTRHDLDSWFASGPSTWQHARTFLSWARRQRILRGVELPVIHTGAGAPPPAPTTRLAAIRRPLPGDALAPGDRVAGCLVVLCGQQASRIAALRTTEVSCTGDVTRLTPGTDWLDVPEPAATLLRPAAT